MTRGKIVTLSTRLFYPLLAILMIILERVSPGGPCVPGGGILLLILLPIIAGTGLIVSLIGWAGGHASFKGPTLINGAVLLFIVLFLPFARWLH